MSYDKDDATMDEMYEQISKELYPGHKLQAVSEFTAERLRSFYLDNPMVMRPAVDVLKEVQRLQEGRHYAAATVFCATAIELFLKATVLQPIVYGLVHSQGLADVIVKHAVGQTGFDRYLDLLSRLFQDLANINLAEIRRDGAAEALIKESRAVQELRNKIIHRGCICTQTEASGAIEVTVAVYEKIVVPMLGALDLTVVAKGRIERMPRT